MRVCKNARNSEHMTRSWSIILRGRSEVIINGRSDPILR
jgi:hypothetical protein